MVSASHPLMPYLQPRVESIQEKTLSLSSEVKDFRRSRATTEEASLGRVISFHPHRSPHNLFINTSKQNSPIVIPPVISLLFTFHKTGAGGCVANRGFMPIRSLVLVFYRGGK